MEVEEEKKKKMDEGGEPEQNEAAAEVETDAAADTVAEAEAANDAAQESGESAEEGDDVASGEDADAEAKPSEDDDKKTPDWKDMYARAMADFDNFRKRTARDREDLAKFAASDVLKDLLPTADDLARALDEAKEREDDPFVSGVKLVYEGLLKTLADHGATPIDSVGEPFDANYHEALAQLPSEDVEEGVIMNEVKRGWLLNGKLLRAAQVVVSSGKKA